MKGWMRKARIKRKVRALVKKGKKKVIVNGKGNQASSKASRPSSSKAQ